MYQRLDSYQNPPGARGRSAVIVQLWWIVQSTLFGMSPHVMFGWRRFLLRLFGAKVGKGVLVRPSARFTYPWKVSIGDNCWIGDDAVLYSLDTITIGHDVVISQSAYLCTGNHNYNLPTFNLVTKPIVVEPEAWIATDVFVAPGICIGRGAVIGARSTVTRDIPAGAVCRGNPAVKVKERMEIPN